MKDMGEFRRAVYEKAEMRSAEEKIKKLRLKKLATFAACFAVIAAPVLVALGTDSGSNKEEYFYATNQGGGFGDGCVTVGRTSAYDAAPEVAESSQKYTTTRVYFLPESTSASSEIKATEWETTIATTTPVFTYTESVQTSAPYFPGTATGTVGDHAEIKVGGRRIVLNEGMTYTEICGIIGAEGETLRVSNVYRWEADDAVLTVEFELGGGSDESLGERLKAVSFAVCS